jgi:hypothetical protein
MRPPARQRSGSPLAPTVSRWENAPTLRQVIRLTYTLVEFDAELSQARSVALAIDDTVGVVQRYRNWRSGTRTMMSGDLSTSTVRRPALRLLCLGKIQRNKEVRKLLSRLIGRIHRHWPETRITIAVTAITAERGNDVAREHCVDHMKGRPHQPGRGAMFVTP